MKIKICCIKNIKESEIAINAGADILGLVSKMPSGPGVIEEETISEIAAHVKGKAETFLLTSETEAGRIIEQQKRCGTSAIQLVDSVPFNAYDQLHRNLEGVKLVQVIHVRNEEAIQEAVSIQNYVDYILLDSGNPGLQKKVLGGTGKTHNWKISRRLIESVDIPVFLAGGLNPENVSRALKEVSPFGIDVCSGVRKENNLDEEKLSMFIRNARGTSLL